MGTDETVKTRGLGTPMLVFKECIAEDLIARLVDTMRSDVGTVYIDM